MSINYTMLPEHTREGMRAYIETGRPVGSFLNAILKDDFVEAAWRADHINRVRLPDYAEFLETEAPADCWGSRAKVDAWIAARRLENTPIKDDNA